MRFRCRNYGDKRIVKRFALFPICLFDKVLGRKEIRWLEVVYVFQPVDCGIFWKVWESRRFATRGEYKKYKEDIPHA